MFFNSSFRRFSIYANNLATEHFIYWVSPFHVILSSELKCKLLLSDKPPALHFLPLLFPNPTPPHRRLAGAAAPSGDQVKGVRDGGGGKGQKSHDIRPPAGGGVQHSAGFPPPTEARRGLQSGGERPHLHPSPFLRPSSTESCCIVKSEPSPVGVPPS